MEQQASILELMRAAYREVKQRDADFSLTDSLRNDLGIDSLDSIDIIAVIEEQLGVDIDESILEQLGDDANVGDLVVLLEDLTAQGTG